MRTQQRNFRVLILALLLAAAALPTAGDTELVLIDGRVLKGTDMRRDDGGYVLTLENGAEVAFPDELVAEVRLTDRGEPKRAPALRVRQPEELSGGFEPTGPTGIRSDGPRVLAGVEVAAPRTADQLEVLGQPARFQKNIVDSRWEPESDWDMDPEKNNNFAPSTWSKSVIDPSWEPKSAFDPRADVLKNSQSTWQKGVVDSAWQPTDGFNSSVSRN